MTRLKRREGVDLPRCEAAMWVRKTYGYKSDYIRCRCSRTAVQGRFCAQHAKWLRTELFNCMSPTRTKPEDV
jgi:hypothetical protein